MRSGRPDAHTAAAVVSVHDVMPETMGAVEAAVNLLERLSAFPAALLVVPGRNWTQRDISYLKSLEKAGYELAGHGWSHHAAPPASLWHRLHALLISRNEAEHLSLARRQIAGRIRACHQWFASAGLAAPDLYVPPAWAWGPVPRRALQELPFRMYETQWGVYDAEAGIYRRLPVTGYMADTHIREKALRFGNALRRFSTGPFRLAIHPEDLKLGLAGHMKSDLQRVHRFLRYRDLFA